MISGGLQKRRHVFSLLILSFFSYTLFSKISTGNLSFCFFSQPFGRELDSPSEIYKCIVPKSQYKKKAEQKV